MKPRTAQRGGRRFGNHRYSRRTRLEALEDRSLLTVFTVTNLTDGFVAAPEDLPGSLRQALYDANHSAGADSIEWAAGLTGTVTLTHGELQIAQDLTMTGLGGSQTTIDAAGSSRVLTIDDGDTGSLLNVELTGLSIAGGRVDGHGAGILCRENLVFRDGQVFGNEAISGDGAGIYSQFGDVTIVGSVIAENAARSGAGGGIFTASNLSLSASTLQGNHALGRGGAIFASGVAASIANCTIADNYTQGNGGHGGGVYAEWGTTAIVASEICGNSTAGAPAQGGGIYSRYGDLTVTDSMVSGNATQGRGSKGGGVMNETGTLTLQSSLIADNRTTGPSASGGGVLSRGGRVSVVDSTISGNATTSTSDSYGGGLALYTNLSGEQTALIVNSTISGNSTNRLGGGIANGGGLTRIFNSTITDNQAPDGNASGVLSVGLDNTRTEIGSSIIAGNAFSHDVDLAFGAFNSLVSAGYNLLGGGNALSAFTNHDVVNVLDPLLAPLADNGGPTATHAPLTGSPVIDGGDPAAAAGVNNTPEFDQRGAPYARVAGDRIDIGAFEVQRLSVTRTDPAVGSSVAAPPTSFVVHLSRQYDATSIDAEDFRVNNLPADSYVLDDPDTITFLYAVSPVAVEGLQVMAIAPGAIEPVPDVLPLQGFTGAFRYDAVPLEVVATHPPTPGGVFTLPGPWTLDVIFNEPVDPNSASAADMLLSGLRGATATGVLVAPDGLTATFIIDGVMEEGSLAASLAAGAITDVHGNSGAAFSSSYQVDFGTVAFPAPLTPIEPLGALIYSAGQQGAIDPAGDADRFTVLLDPGQTLAILVESSDSLLATIEVYAPDGALLGSATAPAAGADAVLQGVRIPGQIAGHGGGPAAYQIVVGGSAGSTGSYRISTFLNAALETESHDGAANDMLGTAQGLRDALITLDTGDVSARSPHASRGAVLGGLEFEFNTLSDDYYSINLNRGQSLTAVVAVLTGGHVDLSLVGPDGATLALGSPAAASSSELISNFVATASGPHFLKVAGDLGTTYSLVVTRDADFGAEGDDAIATAQDMLGPEVAARRWSMGYIDSARLDYSQGFSAATELISSGSAALVDGVARLTNDQLYQAGSVFSRNAVPITNFDTTFEFQLVPGTVPIADGITFTIRAAGSMAVGIEGNGLGYQGILPSVAVKFDVYDPSLWWSPVVSQSGLLINGEDPGYPQQAPIDLWPFGIDLTSGHRFQVSMHYDGANLNVTITDNVTQNSASQSYAIDLASILGSGQGYVGFTAGTGGLSAVQEILNWEFQSLPGSDYYRVTAAGDAPLEISTQTPGRESGEFSNNLDPRIRLYDATGQLVASNDNGAADGCNAKLKYKVPKRGGGVFYIEVAASDATLEPTQGEYILSVKGAEAPQAPFVVSAIAPANGEHILGSVTELTIDFNDAMLLSTLESTDVLIDGVPASSLTIVDSDTAVFGVSQALNDGDHVVHINAGALTDLQGTAIEAFTSAFYTRRPVFDTRTDYFMYSPWTVQLGDVNNDGYLDMVSSPGFGSYQSAYTVRLGLGDGAFGGESLAGGNFEEYPLEIALADVNNDGHLDIISANYFGGDYDRGVSVLLGSGDGSFQYPIGYPAGYYNNSVAVGDVTGDGAPDIVTTNQYDYSVAVLVNQGDGVFDAPVVYGVSEEPWDVALADVDGVNGLDLVVANFYGGYYGQSLTVLLNAGDGTFGPGTGVFAGYYNSAVALDDVDGDGAPDIVTANYYDNAVSVALNENDGSGAFGFPTSYPVGGYYVRGLAVGDVDGDGAVDIVTSAEYNEFYSNGVVSTLLNDGAGGFGDLQTVDAAYGAYSAALGDLNSDGMLDFVAGAYSAYAASVFLNTAAPSVRALSGGAYALSFSSTESLLRDAAAPPAPGRIASPSGLSSAEVSLACLRRREFGPPMTCTATTGGTADSGGHDVLSSPDIDAWSEPDTDWTPDDLDATIAALADDLAVQWSC